MVFLGNQDAGRIIYDNKAKFMSGEDQNKIVRFLIKNNCQKRGTVYSFGPSPAQRITKQIDTENPGHK